MDCATCVDHLRLKLFAGKPWLEHSRNRYARHRDEDTLGDERMSRNRIKYRKSYFGDA